MVQIKYIHVWSQWRWNQIVATLCVVFSIYKIKVIRFGTPFPFSFSFSVLSLSFSYSIFCWAPFSTSLLVSSLSSQETVHIFFNQQRQYINFLLMQITILWKHFSLTLTSLQLFTNWYTSDMFYASALVILDDDWYKI